MNGDPLCGRCVGRGWVRGVDDDCRCVGDVDVYAFDAPPVLEDEDVDALEHVLRRELAAARAPRSAHDAHVLAVARGRGAVPTVPQVAAFAGVTSDVAVRVVEAMGGVR